jgi:hypothetical protein
MQINVLRGAFLTLRPNGDATADGSLSCEAVAGSAFTKKPGWQPGHEKTPECNIR